MTVLTLTLTFAVGESLSNNYGVPESPAEGRVDSKATFRPPWGVSLLDFEVAPSEVGLGYWRLVHPEGT